MAIFIWFYQTMLRVIGLGGRTRTAAPAEGAEYQRTVARQTAAIRTRIEKEVRTDRQTGAAVARALARAVPDVALVYEMAAEQVRRIEYERAVVLLRDVKADSALCPEAVAVVQEEVTRCRLEAREIHAAAMSHPTSKWWRDENGELHWPRFSAVACVVAVPVAVLGTAFGPIVQSWVAGLL